MHFWNNQTIYESIYTGLFVVVLYFIKPGTFDNKIPHQEKSQSPQHCFLSMNADGQGSNPESQSYGHNDDIHI